MYSFAFPTMLGSNTAKLVKDKEAVKSNLFLVLASERKSLFGDPYFGTALKRALFEQQNSLIVDLIIDEIYTSIIDFVPQVFLNRSDITIWNDHTDLFAEIRYVYMPDNTSDLYIIKLTDNSVFD